jgi:hypothetical protein
MRLGRQVIDGSLTLLIVVEKGQILDNFLIILKGSCTESKDVTDNIFHRQISTLSEDGRSLPLSSHRELKKREVLAKQEIMSGTPVA